MRSPGIGWRRFLVGFAALLFSVHLLYVLELNQYTAVRRRSPSPTKQNNKSDHLVMGPAAGQGLRNRLQCQGVKSLNRTIVLSSSNAAGAGDGVTFVTVFQVYNTTTADARAGAGLLRVGNVSYTKTEKAIAILNVFINFIQVTMPRSNVFILTDPALDLSLRRNSVTVYPIEGEYSRDMLMLQRIRSYINFLETRLHHLQQNLEHVNHYIFTDLDVAVVGDLGKVFQDFSHFDVAITFRNNKDQPLNSGFIAVRGTRDAITRAKLFLMKVLEVYSSRYMKASSMMGDQLALAWVVTSHPNFDTRRFTKPCTFVESIGSTTVLFLPCLTYNWTPPEGAGQFHGMPLDVKVVHFKGSRKRLMLESWNFFRSSSDINDMMCLILMSGRTKELGESFLCLALVISSNCVTYQTKERAKMVSFGLFGTWRRC